MAKTAHKTTDQSDDARINIRTKADFRQTISYAAELSGLDLSNFMMSAAMQRAKEVIRAHEAMRIASPEHRAAFRAALEAPGRSIPALAELLKTPPVLNASKR
ncbi:MAG: DUF1778 domain-containing protein [Rhizobiaceae bacterium]